MMKESVSRHKELNLDQFVSKAGVSESCGAHPQNQRNGFLWCLFFDELKADLIRLRGKREIRTRNFRSINCNIQCFSRSVDYMYYVICKN